VHSRSNDGVARRMHFVVFAALEVHMNDLLFVAITTAFFASAWAYVHACERLG
jgi:hypothetical protein